MIKKIKKGVISLEFNNYGSIVYVIKLKGEYIMIDTSSSENREMLKELLLDAGVMPEKIKKIILTHNHWDHTGNIKLFPNATVYGDRSDFPEDYEDISKLNIKEFKIIKTPGHTKGSFCILYDRILFSGDTLFHRGYVGRTDFPESSPKDMAKSLEKIGKLDFDFLCPGH